VASPAGVAKRIEERETMKAVVSKTLITFVGLVLVVPFVAIALVVGAKAVAGAESTEHNLMLVLFALGAALFSGVKNFGRPAEIERGDSALHIAPKADRKQRQAFLNTFGY
jgi:hypothetical protein